MSEPIKKLVTDETVAELAITHPNPPAYPAWVRSMMLATNPASEATPDMSTDASRAIPEAVINVAIDAIRAGASSVSLGTGHLDEMPIEWVLWIRYADDDGMPAGADCLSYQLLADNSDFVLPERLRGQTAKYEPLEEIIELLAVGLRNGWNATYERDLFGYLSMQRVVTRFPGAPAPKMIQRLRLDSLNINYTGKPGEHISTDVSMSAWPSDHDKDVADYLAVFTDAPTEANQYTHTQYQTNINTARALVNAQAPDFTRMGYFDDALDEWVK